MDQGLSSLQLEWGLCGWADEVLHLREPFYQQAAEITKAEL